ncbi:hypothetical protein Q8G28_10640 [Lysinibacillus capsici]|uniref:hypothetical protein n=1 Tax=Lysinibacillus capsici TaxID=2115968 RepID=UPI002730A571|nr:hypothetical protein [Lysinibacillus capsici]MDP1393479.1 hypothetical protein [Lysinibacillus capsici]MDP1414319.1 hypothetical protein [Lysinibacillus capsici]MDP1430211.1 hypothetical protein [Lysinibacillus capsici]
MNINFFIETIIPIIISVISLVFQLLDRYKPKTESNPSFPAASNTHSRIFIPEIANSSAENRKTIAKWLRKFILIITYSALAVNVYLKLKTTPQLLIDNKTGSPTIEKILNILETSFQQVQHYLLYLIVGLLISMLIIEMIQKKKRKIIYTILLGASAFMAHHIMSTNTFFKLNLMETFSVHNLIQGYLPLILILLFFFQLYLCYFIIDSIFIPKNKTNLIDEKAKQFLKTVIPVILPFCIYIALQI